MDLYQIIKKYKGCKLNPTKSKHQDLKHTAVYKHVTDSQLVKAHKSLVECCVQLKILMSNDFKKYWSMINSIYTIISIWSAKEQKKSISRNSLLKQISFGRLTKKL